MMLQTYLLLNTFFLSGGMPIFDFNEESNLKSWIVLDDVVMGGRSKGNLSVNEEGHAVFQGAVSLENNGGFSSIRYRFPEKKVEAYNKAVLRIKGDGKTYQFRLKSSRWDRQSYIYNFQTSGEWQTIEIPLAKMYPSFRGMKLNMPDYPGKEMEEISILIANKKAETFELEIDWIGLK